MTSHRFVRGDEDYDITVQLPEENRRVTDMLRELMIPTPTGEMVPLSTLATVEYSGSIGDIVRINNERVVTVKANVDESKQWLHDAYWRPYRWLAGEKLTRRE